MYLWTFGEKACHAEPIRFARGKLREGSGSPGAEILRCAQDDSKECYADGAQWRPTSITLFISERNVSRPQK
jgi:hypothetical protein